MKNNYGIIIQCRDESTRMKHKSVRPFWKGKSIFEILYDRLILLDLMIVVATSYNSPKTIKICQDNDIPFYVGPDLSVANRIYFTAKAYRFDGFFRVCADNPFIQLPLMYPVKAWVSPEYDYVAFEDCMKRHEGFWMEYVKTSALRRSLMESGRQEDIEHVTPYIIRHPELFKQKILPIPSELKSSDIRLTVDTISDFYIAKKVYKYMKDGYWMRILDYIDNNPEIKKAMIKNKMENKK